MFNSNLEDLEKRIKKLEDEIFPKEEEQIYFTDVFGYKYPYREERLKEKVDNLKEAQDKDRRLINMLLNKLGLEYVKITEENGYKKVKEILRKKKKKLKK